MESNSKQLNDFIRVNSQMDKVSVYLNKNLSEIHLQLHICKETSLKTLPTREWPIK